MLLNVKIINCIFTLSPGNGRCVAVGWNRDRINQAAQVSVKGSKSGRIGNLRRQTEASGIQEFRSSGVQEVRNSGTQELRKSGTQKVTGRISPCTDASRDCAANQPLYSPLFVTQPTPGLTSPEGGRAVRRYWCRSPYRAVCHSGSLPHGLYVSELAYAKMRQLTTKTALFNAANWDARIGKAR